MRLLTKLSRKRRSRLAAPAVLLAGLMLTGGAYRRLEAGRARERLDHRSHLDRFGAGADDREDAPPGAAFSAAVALWAPEAPEIARVSPAGNPTALKSVATPASSSPRARRARPEWTGPSAA